MSIAKNIETVVSTFQKGRSLSEQEFGLDELISKLNQFEPRYRSVAFEGASMGVAIQNSLGTWNKYAKAAEKHATQVHIGLGWAIAEGQMNLASTLSEIEPDFQVKVLDGYGYWHGLFRRRLTIRTQTIPKNITSEYQSGFDQGIGIASTYVGGCSDELIGELISASSEFKKNFETGIESAESSLKRAQS